MSKSICTVCDRAAVARELCSTHYQRQRKYGDTSIVKGRRSPVSDGGKICPSCATRKPLELFGARPDTLDGRQTRCNQCVVDAHYSRKTDATDNPRECQQCGKVYRPKRRIASVYCSRECKEAARKDKVRVRPTPRPCEHCGTLFTPTGSNTSRQRYCSDECRGDPARIGRNKKLWMYGVDDAWVQAKLAEQGGRCLLCPCDITEKPYIDHDHKCCDTSSGKRKTCGKCVRGLLCYRCNLGLGQFDDDVDRLRAAADYIERHRQTAAYLEAHTS